MSFSDAGENGFPTGEPAAQFGSTGWAVWALFEPESGLFGEFERIRDQGYAVDDEERVKGMRCIAAPILDRDGGVLGAVSVSGPMSRMHDDRFENDIPRRVMSAGNVIEVNMTYS